MRIFFSVGEPSGDVHGANLIRALQRSHSDLECVGFGGDRMAAAGCKLHFPLSNHAVMGLSRVFAALPHFMSLASQADRYFQHHRPDAVVLIDYPGFNWWIARRAKYHGIPVFYFVPPQIWAWASYRVHRMRRFVDHVLCSLPFEEKWYHAHHVNAEYIGHPFFDDLTQQKLDADFLAQQRARPGLILGILPGSRTMEVEGNFRLQLEAARIIHLAHPETRFLVASFKPSQQQIANKMLRDFPDVPIETHVGRTPEIMELSKLCMSVSGSVSLELLYRLKPTVILYRFSRVLTALVRALGNVKYITLVNLLADRELYPEFKGPDWTAGEVAKAMLTWLDDESAYRETLGALETLRSQVAHPGACERAAQRILAVAGGKSLTRAA